MRTERKLGGRNEIRYCGNRRREYIWKHAKKRRNKGYETKEDEVKCKKNEIIKIWRKKLRTELKKE
jgi:hypothetical protein